MCHHNDQQYTIGNIEFMHLIAVDCLHYHSCIQVKETNLLLRKNVFTYTVLDEAMNIIQHGYIKRLVDTYLDFFEKTSPDFMWGTFYPTRQDRLHGKLRQHGPRIIGLYETVAKLSSIIVQHANY